MKIRPETPIEEIVARYPELVSVLMDYGIVCVVCGEPIWGTLEEVATSRGVDLGPLLSRLNEIVDPKAKDSA
jgi:hybrid cluster-associated redox disulfide protein